MNKKENLIDQASQTFIGVIKLIKERFESDIIKCYLKDFNEATLTRVRFDFDDIVSNAHNWLCHTNENFQSLKLAGTKNKITQVTLQWSEACEGYCYKIYYFENNLPYVHQQILHTITYDNCKSYKEDEIIPTVKKEVLKIAEQI